MRVRVIHGLTAVTSSIKDHTVAGVGDTFGQRHLVSLRRHFGEQPVTGRRQRAEVRVVILRNHQHVHRSLWIDIAKCERPRAFEHARSRSFAETDPAE